MAGVFGSADFAVKNLMLIVAFSSLSGYYNYHKDSITNRFPELLTQETTKVVRAPVVSAKTKTQEVDDRDEEEKEESDSYVDKIIGGSKAAKDKREEQDEQEMRAAEEQEAKERAAEEAAEAAAAGAPSVVEEDNLKSRPKVDPSQNEEGSGLVRLEKPTNAPAVTDPPPAGPHVGSIRLEQPTPAPAVTEPPPVRSRTGSVRLEKPTHAPTPIDDSSSGEASLSGVEDDSARGGSQQRTSRSSSASAKRDAAPKVGSAIEEQGAYTDITIPESEVGKVRSEPTKGPTRRRRSASYSENASGGTPSQPDAELIRFSSQPDQSQDADVSVESLGSVRPEASPSSSTSRRRRTLDQADNFGDSEVAGAADLISRRPGSQAKDVQDAQRPEAAPGLDKAKETRMTESPSAPLPSIGEVQVEESVPKQGVTSGKAATSSSDIAQPGGAPESPMNDSVGAEFSASQDLPTKGVGPPRSAATAGASQNTDSQLANAKDLPSRQSADLSLARRPSSTTDSSSEFASAENVPSKIDSKLASTANARNLQTPAPIIDSEFADTQDLLPRQPASAPADRRRRSTAEKTDSEYADAQDVPPKTEVGKALVGAAQPKPNVPIPGLDFAGSQDLPSIVSKGAGPKTAPRAESEFSSAQDLQEASSKRSSPPAAPKDLSKAPGRQSSDESSTEFSTSQDLPAKVATLQGLPNPVTKVSSEQDLPAISAAQQTVPGTGAPTENLPAKVPAPVATSRTRSEFAGAQDLQPRQSIDTPSSVSLNAPVTEPASMMTSSKEYINPIALPKTALGEIALEKPSPTVAAAQNARLKGNIENALPDPVNPTVVSSALPTVGQGRLEKATSAPTVVDGASVSAGSGASQVVKGSSVIAPTNLPKVLGEIVLEETATADSTTSTPSLATDWAVLPKVPQFPEKPVVAPSPTVPAVEQVRLVKPTNSPQVAGGRSAGDVTAGLALVSPTSSAKPLGLVVLEKPSSRGTQSSANNGNSLPQRPLPQTAGPVSAPIPLGKVRLENPTLQPKASAAPASAKPPETASDVSQDVASSGMPANTVGKIRSESTPSGAKLPLSSAAPATETQSGAALRGSVQTAAPETGAVRAEEP